MRKTLLLVLASSTAYADPRVGFELGGGLWGGHMECQSQSGSCDGISAAGGANFEARYFWQPQFGAFVDVWPMAHTENGFTITHVITTAGLQWRLAPIFSVQAGVGGAHASWSYSGITVGESDTGGALLVGASLDMLQGPRWALALEARLGAGFYGTSQNGMTDITGRNEGVGVELSFWGF